MCKQGGKEISPILQQRNIFSFQISEPATNNAYWTLSCGALDRGFGNSVRYLSHWATILKCYSSKNIYDPSGTSLCACVLMILQCIFKSLEVWFYPSTRSAPGVSLLINCISILLNNWQQRLLEQLTAAAWFITVPCFQIWLMNEKTGNWLIQYLCRISENHFEICYKFLKEYIFSLGRMKSYDYSRHLALMFWNIISMVFSVLCGFFFFMK